MTTKMNINKSIIREGPSRSKNIKKQQSKKVQYNQKSPIVQSMPDRHAKGKGRATRFDSDDAVVLEGNAVKSKEKTLVTTSSGRSPVIHRLYIEPSHEALIRQLGGEIWQESLEYFLNQILPPIRSEIKVERILKQCITNKTLRRNRRTKKYSWTFSSPGTDGSSSSETKTFVELLKDIVDAIEDAALGGILPKPSPTCYLYSHGQHSLWPTVDNDIKADATLFLNSPDDTYPEEYEGRHWYNSAFSILIRKSESDESEYIEQMLQCLHHPMVIDPCRRFTLGASIDNTRMRLWLYSRSTIICSEEFDFYSDADTMIRIVLSLMFSDKIDLGWDPTVDAKYDGHQRIFEFKVAGDTFKTSATNLLSDAKAGEIYSSATRIYKAFRAEDESEEEPVIIKDFWPTEMLETEDVIRRMILEDIDDPINADIVQNVMLNPIASGRVKIGEREDHTEETILRGKGPHRKYRVTLPFRGSIDESNSLLWEFEGYEKKMGVMNEDQERILEGKRRKAYNYRWHYRIVYKEYAIPYNKLQNLDDIFLVLVCAVKALSVIHKAGWVHRDLSPGNLYLYTDPSTGEKRGLVGDLEFAKRVGTGAEGDGMVGTANYMAVEVMKQEYQFKPTKTSSRSSFPSELNADVLHNLYVKALAKIEQKVDPLPEKRISANYLHDLESFLWVAIWTLFNFQEASLAVPATKESKRIKDLQLRICDILFTGCMEYRSREFFLFDTSEFHRYLLCLTDHLDDLRALIIVIRNALVSSYERAEKEGSEVILPTDEDPIHLHIMEYFKRIPRNGIKVRNIWEVSEDVINKTRSKRSTYDTRDDEQQPTNKKRSIQGSNDVKSSGSTISSMTQDVNEEPREEMEGMTLRSGHKYKQNNRAHVPGRKAVGRSKRTVKEKVPVVNENRRITRSMAKKLSPTAATNTVRTRTRGLNARKRTARSRK